MKVTPHRMVCAVMAIFAIGACAIADVVPPPSPTDSVSPSPTDSSAQPTDSPSQTPNPDHYDPLQGHPSAWHEQVTIVDPESPNDIYYGGAIGFGAALIIGLPLVFLRKRS